MLADFTFTCRGIDNNLVGETVSVSVTEAPPAIAPTAPTQNNDADSIAFNETAQFDELSGSLQATVFFAQSQIIPARSNETNRQPHLVANPDEQIPCQCSRRQ